MPKVKTFFLRVASRCNFSCDYCYVFKHRDTSWKNYPPCMNRSLIKLFALRLRDYILESNIKEIDIIFHGGEPLTIGNDKIIEYSDIIRDIIGNNINIFFSIQTNGSLLSKKFIDRCLAKNISISVSLDGPDFIHDKHRITKNGTGSFDIVYNNIKLLRNYPSIFTGIIGVIDPEFPPSEIFKFYDENRLFNIDLLLPDSTYQDPPVGREQNKHLYSEWLSTAFDCWFKKYQNLHFRTFENILKAILGEPQNSDTFGLGELDYLTIESDGSYHTSDIMKISYENASAISGNLNNMSISEALNSDAVKNYNLLLNYSGLAEKCKKCKSLKICGGGSLPHRYSIENKFKNPSIYCEEMLCLIECASDLLKKELENEVK